MEKWAPKIGDDSLHLKCEDKNEHDKYSVVVMIGEKTGGHIPKHLRS